MQECKSKEDEDHMLLCDWCQAAVHMYCLSPPLTEFPDADVWYCEMCTPIVAQQKVANEILERHEKACAEAAKRVDAMAELLAGVGVKDEVPMVTDTMVSANGDADEYACVTSPCKPAPGVNKSDTAPKVRCLSLIHISEPTRPY